MAALAAVSVLVGGGAFVSVGGATKLGALMAALALPTLAVCSRRRDLKAALTRGRALGKALLLFAATSGLSILGGLLVVGCLADTRYMVKLDQFSGVKLAHVIPLLGVLALQVGWDLGSRGAQPGESRIATLIRGWQEAAQAAVRYWHAVLLLVCAAALGLMVLRSGNEAGSSVPGLEMTFRSLLNHVFGVRPRTKEVLIGHPLLFLAFARMAGGRSVGRWALLTVGTIGQVSLVNTFTHLHTPLLISVERTLHGLWAGALVGLVLYAVVEGVEALWRKLTPAADSS
jgi:Family of unknown function (DUF5693)